MQLACEQVRRQTGYPRLAAPPPWMPLTLTRLTPNIRHRLRLADIAPFPTGEKNDKIRSFLSLRTEHVSGGTEHESCAQLESGGRGYS